MNHSSISFQVKALRLRVEVQSLMLHCFKTSKSEEFDKCRRIDHDLNILIKSLKKFDFIANLNEGSSLFIGEGNLSFTCELAQRISNPECMTATTYEGVDSYDDFSIQNKQKLQQMGVTVLDGIDGTKLHLNMLCHKFHLIVFQFPHTGKQEYHDGQTPNFDLVRNFLISSKTQLHHKGVIAITYVNNSYYNGIFQFEKLRRELQFSAMEKYTFDPKDFPNYKHKMTNKDESGIVDHDQFATMVFSI